MKFFLYIFYFLRSAILRGLLNTIKMGTLELKHEKKFGIKTTAITPARNAEYFHYQGAGYSMVIRMLNDLVKGREDFHFIDIGCGKGRVLIVAESCGFRQITGIELYPDLLKTAAENIKSYSARRNDSVITLLQENALHYNYLNEPAIYFLFNPFSEEILKHVLLKIVQSTRSETWFIYMNPRYAKVFAELGINKDRVYKTRWYTEAIIYKLDAQP